MIDTIAKLIFILILLLGLTSTANAYDTGLKKNVKCLALNIYHESRGEGINGMQAVAWVTINRVKSKRYPNKICDVVYQKSQFSWTTKKDITPYEKDSWKKSIIIARKIVNGDIKEDPTDGALFFHNTSVKPYWINKLTKTKKIGKHIYYR